MYSDYYVYAHIRLDSWEVFYIGRGRGRRAWLGTRNVWHKRICDKHGCGVLLLHKELSLDVANSKEMEEISNAKLRGVRLTNITEGGDGMSGERGKKAGLRTSELCRKAGKGIFGMSHEDHVAAGRQSNWVNKLRGTGIYGITKEMARAVGRKVCGVKWQCTTCGLISNAAALGNHFKSSGHRGKERMRINPRSSMQSVNTGPKFHEM